MTDDPRQLREPKRDRPSLWQRMRLWVGLPLMALIVAVVGVNFTDFAERASINYRTDVSTEVHRMQGEAYVHLGDGKAVAQVPLGAHMYIHNVYIKTETCHGFTSNVFWGIDNHVVVHYSMFTNWFYAGKYEAEELFTVPDYIPPGRYKIVKRTVSFCNGREHYTTNYEVVVEFTRLKSAKDTH